MKTTCSICGKELSEDEVFSYNGNTYCEACYGHETVVCDDCSERLLRSDAIFDDGMVLCENCYDRYTHCEDCGALIYEGDANYSGGYAYCDSCYEKIESRAIKDYGFKPEPVFYGDGSLYLGVELEIDEGGEDSFNAEKILETGNCEDNHIYCKHDGSLEDGFEIVSHPMTLEYHQSRMPWENVINKALSMEYLSHDTDSCGLHIHINRSFFGKNYDEQEQGIGRVVYFVEHHWNELVRFSRRTSDNLERWAARYATVSPTAKETYSKAKAKRAGRYVAVNLENANTIEFRMFRGTLRYETFMATLELVAEICRLAKNKCDWELEEMSWSDFVLGISPDKTELISYLKQKRLYVNEIETIGEEAAS